MTSVDDALRQILGCARQLEAVRLPLIAALGPVLRADARADLDSPPFDASAMDGYAARRADLGPPLRVIGESIAGGGFAGTVGPGECVRILTGAPVPAGADCVVKQEDVVRDGSVIRAQRADGPTYIRRRGENRHAGDIVVPAGTRLRAPELAALASAGITCPEVTRAPRVAHVVTGDELIPPDRVPTGGQIRDSNSTLIAALLVGHGSDLVAQHSVGDDLAASRAVLAGLPPHDVLLISGGASVGDRDLARPMLADLGYETVFDSVNLRPGKPLLFARRGAQLAFALPGNPVSHWVVFHLFVAPLLAALQSGLSQSPAVRTGRLAAGAQPPPADARRTCWPSRVAWRNGGYELTPLRLASSGDSSGLAGANALWLVPAGTDLAPGQPVEFHPCP